MRVESGRPWARAGFLALMALSAALAGCSGEGLLRVEDARVRDLIPGQDKTVAYLDLRNPGSAPVVLVGAESPQARAIEMHTTTRDGGVMRMRRLQQVEIPPGETIRFQPGGHHLMLFGVRSLQEHILIRLIFADGSRQEVAFRRVEIGAG